MSILQGLSTGYRPAADRTRGVPCKRCCGSKATRHGGSLLYASRLSTRAVVYAVKNLHDPHVAPRVQRALDSKHLFSFSMKFAQHFALRHVFTGVFSANPLADSARTTSGASERMNPTSDLHGTSGTEKSQQRCSLAWSLAPIYVGLSTAVGELRANCIFMSAFWSWFIAQIAKLFTAAYREGKWDYRVMFDSGGMPSSHTALVVGLTTSITYQYGLGSVYFPLSLAFTLIVMYDAAGVRRHAGKQAEVLNRIVEDFFHGSAISDKKLKEVLGHSPLQVACGAILGAMVGTIYMIRYAV